jgi:hypothetical protein
MDPNVQTTIGSPIEWYKLEVMRDVINVKEAWESYHKNFSSGIQIENNVIKARTQSLFNSLYPYLKRKLDPKIFDKTKDQLFGVKPLQDKDLLEIFWLIQTQLDVDCIIKMDTRKSYDGTHVEKENQNFGL